MNPMQVTNIKVRKSTVYAQIRSSLIERNISSDPTHDRSSIIFKQEENNQPENEKEAEEFLFSDRVL